MLYLVRQACTVGPVRLVLSRRRRVAVITSALLTVVGGLTSLIGTVASEPVLTFAGIWLLFAAVGILLFALLRAVNAIHLTLSRVVSSEELSRAATEIHELRAMWRWGPGGMRSTMRLDAQRDMTAVAALHGRFGGRSASVPMTPYSSLPESSAILVSVVDTLPEGATVVELGSGVSTVWTAMAVRERTAVRFVSLEHDPDWCRATAIGLERSGVAEDVALRQSPLEPDAEGRLWYRLSDLEDVATIDLLFIDGPPGDGGPHAREPAVDHLAGRLRSGAIVIIDDADRPDERRVVDRFLEYPFTEGQAAILEARERIAVIRVP